MIPVAQVKRALNIGRGVTDSDDVLRTPLHYSEAIGYTENTRKTRK